MINAGTGAVETNEVSEREIRHRKLAREAASESIVLLQNDGALPMDACPVALYGAGGSVTIKGGTGSGEVNERYSVTIEKGLADAGFTIVTGPYLREYEELLRTEKSKFSKNLSKKILFGGANALINIMSNQFQHPPGRLITGDEAKNCGVDTCIYVVARQAGECSERKLEKFDYDLTQTEIENITTLSENFTRTIVVINAGGQMDLGPLDGLDINAILYFCQQGMEGGNALADILTGAVTPSGCLSSTWPQRYEDLPNAMQYSYLKGHTDYDEYNEGLYVGYRYFDSFYLKPRYELGYGLSYTGFNIGVSDVSASGTTVVATVKVTNTGARYSGKKTVQLYVSVPTGRLHREYQHLAAFAKTEVIAPDSETEITLSFDLTDLAGYDEEAASFILEKGFYVVRIGESSGKTKVAAVIKLDDTVTTETCMNVCVPAAKLDEIKLPETAQYDIPVDVIKILVSAGAIPCKTHDYQPPAPGSDEKIGEILRKLSVEDMIKLVCGTGIMSSDPVFRVPGAAGYTTSHLTELGVPNSALCDGPAGVRVQRRSVRYKNGKIKSVDLMMDMMEGLPGFVKKAMTGNPDKGTLLFQHASAFPVGTAQAQTWNTEIVERIGDAIGTEMEEFGVTFWLAPGMNIHRNPLCGRNFEYYSEDPLLTGKMAAAVTRGVQSHDGCYVTIKHYAANNQEDNRNKSDSRLNERTLREIYLKGFRIAVEEGGAKSVMTSYNKLNGTYTPNSYDLCTNLLRCEWGFDGVVMTDWFSTGKGLGGNGAAIKAGNDLIMPGGKWQMKEIKADLKTGALKEEELRLCCARVLKAVLNGRTGMMVK